VPRSVFFTLMTAAGWPQASGVSFDDRAVKGVAEVLDSGQ